MVQEKPIPILDLTTEVEQLWGQLAPVLEKTIRSGQFILGPETKSFEKEAAEYLGVKHAIGCNSGTDALIIGLRAIGVECGDEVITTPFSFFATAESISIIGAKPVFVDIDLDSMNLDPDLVEAAITPKTKAIMPVHLFGRPAQMTRLVEIAEKHGLQIIEDCAQSFGAAYQPLDGEGGSAAIKDRIRGKVTGSIGAVGAFSFFPTKNLGAYGDGGLITTDDDKVAELSLKLRVHGSAKRYHNEMLGYNSRLDSLQAAILRLKLPLVDGYNQARRAVAKLYGELLSDVPGVVAPEVVDGHVFHQYTVRLLDADRDAVQAKMQAQGVSSMIYYPIPQDRLEVYAGKYPPFAKSDTLAKQVLSLPIWPQISPEQQQRVVEVLKASL